MILSVKGQKHHKSTNKISIYDSCAIIPSLLKLFEKQEQTGAPFLLMTHNILKPDTSEGNIFYFEHKANG